MVDSVNEPGAALLARVRQDLDDVEVAMRRLQDGSYGRCEQCHAPLSPERLAAEPAARRCPHCP